MTNFNFNLNDLDKSLLDKQIEKNVELIYSSYEARNGRTREEIRHAVGIGIPCEVFLMQFHECVNFEHKYGDVITPNNVKIECKASNYSWTEEKKFEIIDKIKSYNPSDVVMFWHKKGNTYTYQGYERLKY